jgi:hypothetical protein
MCPNLGDYQMIRKLATAALAALCLSACTSSTLTTSFNASEAAFINKQGTATITGQGFLRRNDGVVVYAAGSEVRLVPQTPYSNERFRSIYGAAKQSYFGGTFKNDTPEYYDYTRTTVADGEGRFTFSNVSAGSYYLTTSVVWMAGYSRQGGAIMERVTVQNGQSVNVVMSGQ